MSDRLSLALEGGGLALPDSGKIAVLLPRAGMDLSALPRDRVVVVQPQKPEFDRFVQAGFEVSPDLVNIPSPVSAVLVCLPRAKAQARALVARACDLSPDVVIVDGAKTDGADSLLRESRNRVAVTGPISKAHGKIFWFAPDAAAFADWRAPERQEANGFVTAPGVFSADSVDPASAMLAAALPARLGHHVVDLGAGWGYLSRAVLKDTKVEVLDLVEADRTALDCARINISDPRARFHWADATAWRSSDRIDAVVMNPPFHTGRDATPALGRAFIDAAARLLTPSGGLWMVANRHLPYETALRDRFAQVVEVAGDGKFKVIHAGRPKKPGKR